MNPHVLQLHLDTYIGMREALGFQKRTERTLLNDFVRFLDVRQDAEPIRAQLAVEWACATSEQRSPRGAARRLSVARGFLAYLRTTFPETEVPAPNLLASARRPTPYLLTPQQIQALMRTAREVGSRGCLRPYTVSTLIGVLASTGLRVGEAIRLTMADVQLDGTPPLLHIRETKGHKSRLVPLHPTTAAQLRHYRALRTDHHGEGLSDVFFVSKQGRALRHVTLGRWFATLCRQVGMEPTPGGRRPSLHALRHAFAIERIRLWYQEGADVQALLPTLSVYLGHVRPQESYWYVTATPELLSAAATRFQHYAARGEA